MNNALFMFEMFVINVPFWIIPSTGAFLLTGTRRFRSVGGAIIVIYIAMVTVLVAEEGPLDGSDQWALIYSVLVPVLAASFGRIRMNRSSL